jgi:hypothetical protein
MTGLSTAGSTRYYYRFGDKQVGLTPLTYSFKSAASPGSQEDLKVMLYGDMGLDYSKNTRAMLARMAKAEEGSADAFDWVIHNGDISYADNHIGATKLHPTVYIDWLDVFYGNVSAYSATKPYMLAPGNHEFPCSYGEYNAHAVQMPHWASESSDAQYYSYTVGQLHVISLSGESGRLKNNTSAEVVWLEKDLVKAKAARDRGEISWILTHVHYPNVPTGYCTSMMGYCCADGKVGLRTELEGRERFESLHYASPAAGDAEAAVGAEVEVEAEAEAEAGAQACVDSFMTPTNKYVEDLFVKYGVDLHFTAHQHVYERTTPVYRYRAYGNDSEPFPIDANGTHTNDGSLFVDPAYPINVNNGCPGNVELQDVWMPRPQWSVGWRYVRGTG